jgi:hypothetical protein
MCSLIPMAVIKYSSSNAKMPSWGRMSFLATQEEAEEVPAYDDPGWLPSQ